MAGCTERGEWDELAGTGVVTHQIQSRVKASIRLCVHDGISRSLLWGTSVLCADIRLTSLMRCGTNIVS